jgi:hypothetical protein
MRPAQHHLRTIFTVAFAVLVSVCAPRSVAQDRSLAFEWVARHDFASVLSLAMSDGGPRLFSRREFADALVRSGSHHSQVEREIALAALVERTPPSEADEVLGRILPQSNEFGQWSLLSATLRLVNRSPQTHDDPRVRDFLASTLDAVALALAERLLPPDATSATLAAIDAARLLDHQSAADSLTLIAQHSRDVEVVREARAAARALLGEQ